LTIRVGLRNKMPELASGSRHARANLQIVADWMREQARSPSEGDLLDAAERIDAFSQGKKK